MLSYVLLSVSSPPWQRLEPPFSERVDLTSDSLKMRRSLSWQASKDRPAMHGLSPLCWRVAASRPRCRRLERSHLAAIEPRKDASDADTIATCSDPHAGEAITLRDLERVPNAFRRDQESPRVFPKLDEVRNIRKKVLRRNDSVTIAGAPRAEKR